MARVTERIRTSLDRAPSGWTEAEIRARAQAKAREAWRQSQILVVSLHDPRLDAWQREMVRRLGDFLDGGQTA